MGMEKLKNITFFKGFSEDVLKLFMPLVSEAQVKAGDLIFEEGSVSDRFFIIKDGEVEIRKVIDRYSERYKLIAVLSRGEFFGEMAVFLGQPRSAEAIARTDTTLLTISKDVLLSLFNQSPDSAFKIMEFVTSMLMDRLRNTTKELVAVYETGRVITAARSKKELSEHTIEGLAGAIESVDGILLALWNEFNGEFEVSGQVGFDLELGAFVPEDEPLVRWLSEKKESFLSFDMENDARLSIEAGDPLFGRSIVASPLFFKDKMQGFIVLLNRTKSNAFSYNHMVLLSAIAGYVTVALENMGFIQEEVDRSRLSQAKSSVPL